MLPKWQHTNGMGVHGNFLGRGNRVFPGVETLKILLKTPKMQLSPKKTHKNHLFLKARAIQIGKVKAG